jgi:hypothetical protein
VGNIIFYGKAIGAISIFILTLVARPARLSIGASAEPHAACGRSRRWPSSPSWWPCARAAWPG